VQINGHDVSWLGYENIIVEYIPPLNPNLHAHGMIYRSEDGPAFFDRNDHERTGEAHIATPAPVSVYTVPNGLGHPLSNCYLYGGSRTDATITVTVLDQDQLGVPCIPAEDLWLGTTYGGLVACGYGSIADGPTDQYGQTTFSGPVAGGHHTDPGGGERTVVYLDGNPLPTTFNVQFNSPDVNGDLVVNLADVPPFASAFHGSYTYACDYFWDGVINLSDLSLLTLSVGASCPAAQASVPESDPASAMGVYFDADAGSRTLQIKPFETCEAYLMVTGPTAREDIRGWQCHLDVSDNLIVRGYSYPVKSVNLTAPPDFTIGTAAAIPTLPDGQATLLMTMTLQVVDKEPAFLFLGKQPLAAGAAAGLVCVDGEHARMRRLGLPPGVPQGSPVAVINGAEEPGIGNTGALTRAGLALESSPNPFNPATTISYRLVEPASILLAVYDAAGRCVATLAEGYCASGQHTIRWDGRDTSGRPLSSGIYFALLRTGAERVIHKMSLLR
jgi:hypothetical protein